MEAVPAGSGFLASYPQYIKDNAFRVLKREKHADPSNNSAGEAGMNMSSLCRLQQIVNDESGQERQAVLQQTKPAQVAHQNRNARPCFLGRDRVAKG